MYKKTHCLFHKHSSWPHLSCLEPISSLLEKTWNLEDITHKFVQNLNQNLLTTLASSVYKVRFDHCFMLSIQRLTRLELHLINVFTLNPHSDIHTCASRTADNFIYFFIIYLLEIFPLFSPNKNKLKSMLIFPACVQGWFVRMFEAAAYSLVFTEQKLKTWDWTNAEFHSHSVSDICLSTVCTLTIQQYVWMDFFPPYQLKDRWIPHGCTLFMNETSKRDFLYV